MPERWPSASPITREHQPYEIASTDRTSAKIVIALIHRARHRAAPERQEGIARYGEGGARPGNADNGDDHDDARDEPGDGHPEATKQHPEYIEEEWERCHGISLRDRGTCGGDRAHSR